MNTYSSSETRPPLAARAHWPKGVPHTLCVPRVTLDDYLEVTARRTPDKPAILFGGACISYAALWRHVQALAGYLQQRLGVQAGDRVLLQSQNCPQFTIASYAIFRAGAVLVPVSAMTTATELRYYASDSGARVAIVAQELLASVQPCMEQGLLDAALVHAYSDMLPADPDEGLPEVVTAPRAPLPGGNYHGFQAALDQGLEPLPRTAGPDHLAVLPYTSGTTGYPKGCMHTHATMLAWVVAGQVWRGIHADMVSLTVAPMFHMLGLQAGMNVPMVTGGTVVMMPRWDALQAARLIERHRVSVWSAPPSMVIDLFAKADAHQIDLSSLVLLGGGGAAMPEAVAAMPAERFGLHYNEAYGLTETAAFLHANSVHRGKRQCLGMATQGVHSMIVDPETLQELPQGEVGELVTCGPQVMRGYWRNEEADREAFFERDGRRYFRTGDLALVDEEGYFFMRDRLKRMINASGFKVWPAEVENLLYGHPAVQEACVIGVADVRRGETVKAVVVRKSGATLSEEDLVAWCRAQMAAYKVPRLVTFVDQLPKSATGKIQWRQLQEAAQKETSHV